MSVTLTAATGSSCLHRDLAVAQVLFSNPKKEEEKQSN